MLHCMQWFSGGAAAATHLHQQPPRHPLHQQHDACRVAEQRHEELNQLRRGRHLQAEQQQSTVATQNSLKACTTSSSSCKQ
jgi:hypothetical protein